jgi:hypothetical protein
MASFTWRRHGYSIPAGFDQWFLLPSRGMSSWLGALSLKGNRRKLRQFLRAAEENNLASALQPESFGIKKKNPRTRAASGRRHFGVWLGTALLPHGHPFCEYALWMMRPRHGEPFRDVRVILPDWQ